MWTIIAAMVIGGVMCMGACLLGGMLVFKTKRESHESMFRLKQPEGEAFNVDDGLEFPDIESVKPSTTIAAQNERMLKQMGESFNAD